MATSSRSKTPYQSKSSFVDEAEDAVRRSDPNGFDIVEVIEKSVGHVWSSQTSDDTMLEAAFRVVAGNVENSLREERTFRFVRDKTRFELTVKTEPNG